MDFNPDSPAQLSTLLFGGVIKSIVREPVLAPNGMPVIVKTGKNAGEIKFHNVTKQEQIKGLGLVPVKKTPTGNPSTDDEVLGQLDHPIAKLIHKTRKLKKLIGTYYEGTEELIYPDGCVHACFHHSLTDTGRLSASNPNIENQPKSSESKVKEHFVSRYGDQGVIIEADYSQIEIAVQAQISGDKTYIADVIMGIDFHSKRLAMKEQIPYDEVIDKIKIRKDPKWIEKRSKIKQFSFQRSYGAGATKISKSTGIPIEDVKELIANEDLEYDRLRIFNEQMAECVNESSKRSDFGYYKSKITNKRYGFTREYPKPEDPDWRKKKGGTFSPTKMKNFIVQGTAADIMLIMLGMLFRESIKYRDKFVLVNVVHDSVVIDCKTEYKDLACTILSSVLESTNTMMKDRFSFDWIVPIKIETKTGKNWYECE